MPDAAAAAVRRGHALAVWAQGGVVRRLTGGGALRVALLWTLGTAAAALLLLRLAAGGPGVWIAALAAAAAALAVQGPIARALAAEAAGPHAARAARHLARAAGVAAALGVALAAGLAGWGADPAAVPPAQSLWVAEAFAALRLWAGAEAALYGRAVALGLLPGWAEGALALAAQAAAGWAAASVALAAAAPAQVWRRAIGPASDAPAPPPPGRGALAAAAAVAAAGLAAALAGEARLAAAAPGARPVAQVQVAVERMGDAFYRPGTVAALERAGAAAAAEDAAIRAALPAAIDAGFDAMVANVDPFLDRYYSLAGEYARLAAWLGGDLEARLARELEAALLRGDPMGRVAALLAEADALEHARARAADVARAGEIEAAGLNPARLRVVADRPAPVPWPPLATPGFATVLAERVAIAGAGGALAGWVASRIVARVVAGGVVRLLARALVLPAAILPGAVLIDWGLIEAEEALNRAAFRAEIVAEIEAARAAALAALE